MATTYLSQTFSTYDSTKIFTLSTWLKKSSNGVNNAIYGKDGATDSASQFYFDTSDQLRFFDNTSSTACDVKTNRVFRDNSSFYHIVLSVDTTQATASNRVKIYVNGTQETSFATSTYPAQNSTLISLDSAKDTFVGVSENTGGTKFGYFDGALAHYHFIDGTAYDASYFGETDTASGIWKPKTSPSVTYGTNGFFLKFANSGSLGTDSSGNGNNFTVNGTGTQTLDTPSNVFATGNPLIDFSGTQVNYVNATNGNTTITANSTMPTNKWYYEYKVTALSTSNNGTSHGWSTEKNIRMGSNTWAASNTLWLYATDGDVFNGTWAGAGTAPTYTTGDIIGCALDLENNTVKWYKNGTLAYTFSSVTFDGDLIFPCLQCVTAGSTVSANFGNGYFGTTAVASGNADGDGYGIFEYAPPTGYYALCTKNINTYG